MVCGTGLAGSRTDESKFKAFFRICSALAPKSLNCQVGLATIGHFDLSKVSQPQRPAEGPYS